MNNDEIKILDKKIIAFNVMLDNFKKLNQVNELELKEALNDLLGQIEITLKRTNINNKNKKLISAFKYANNLKKHSNSIYNYSIKTLALYPSDDLYPSDNLYPSVFGIWWNDLPLDDERFVYQYDCYNKYLLNKDLKESINDIYAIIKLNYNYFF